MVRERAERGDGSSARLRSSLSVAELRQLITLMNSSDIEEITVGIFRAAPRPGKPAIHQGDAVRGGQAVAAIEALNVLNEVEIEAAGKVKEVLVNDGQAVEYGQVLMVVEPQVG
jgi:acetyl-CoA carboxylase biotin carboxyl carrier protein